MPHIWYDVDVALAEVPVNIVQLTDDTDFKTRETGIVYNQAGMDLAWQFVTPAGACTYTAVTPTTGGDYDWVHQGDGIYTIEIPASGGASINNDTEGFGRFVGYCTGVMPWVGPWLGFRSAPHNDALIESALTVLLNKIADHTIRRTFQNACDSSDGDTKTGRSLLGAIAKLVNKISVTGSTLTVTEDDDTTSLFTQTLTTDSGADPVTAADTV